MTQGYENNPNEVADAASFRFAAAIEYAGAAYSGWQTQLEEGVSTVQEKLEEALSKIANQPISVVCAGRTDAGVNASRQIIHFDSQVWRESRAWVMGTNTKLPDDIAVKWVVPVADDFHARFSATARRYRYVIYSAEVKPALLPRGITWTYKTLDEARMHRAAQVLVGEHDFTSYRAVACQAKSPIREIKHLNVYRQGDLIIIDVKANAFLHHMVRNLAGVLMKIGAGEAPESWAKEVLDAKDRRQGGVTAPPWGLYFVDVFYPEQFALPQEKVGPYFISN